MSKRIAMELNSTTADAEAPVPHSYLACVILGSSVSTFRAEKMIPLVAQVMIKSR